MISIETPMVLGGLMRLSWYPGLFHELTVSLMVGSGKKKGAVLGFNTDQLPLVV